MKKAKPHKREGYWYLIRRVPTAVAHLDSRKFARVSTNIAIVDDPRGVRAQRAVDKISANLEEYWNSLLSGGPLETRAQYEVARRKAWLLGYNYEPVSSFEQFPIEKNTHSDALDFREWWQD